MDLDNINNIEVLRKIAKNGRAQLKYDIDEIFRKGFWYLVEQDYFGVTIFSDDYQYEKTFTYEEAEKCLERFWQVNKEEF